MKDFFGRRPLLVGLILLGLLVSHHFSWLSFDTPESKPASARPDKPSDATKLAAPGSSVRRAASSGSRWTPRTISLPTAVRPMPAVKVSSARA